MSSQSNNDLRFRQLLRQWQEGSFTRADEQEMEKLVREDAFLREAWEGATSQPETDQRAAMMRLRARLQDKTGIVEKQRSVWPRLLAAAASVTLFAVAVLVWKSQEKVIAPGDLAQQLPTAPAPEPAIEQQTVAAQEQPASAGKTAASTRSNAPAPAGPMSIPEKSDAPAPTIAAAPPARDIVAPEEAKETMADLSRSSPEAEKPASDDAATQNPVETGVMDEVVVNTRRMGNMDPAYSKKEKDQTKPGAPKSADALKKSSSEPQPSIGWAAFKDYLAQNTQKPDAAVRNGISGTVKVRISFDAQGRPVNYAIEKPLGFKCDEMAIQVLKNYNGGWTPGKSSSIIVEVEFK